MGSKVILRQGRDHSLRQRHPWIFSGAIERVEGSPGSGETIEVFSAEGEFLAKAAYSPQSSIRGRVWSWSDSEIDPEFFENSLRRSIQSRSRLKLDAMDSALRLVHAESDGLPGVVVDRYADVLVLQCLTAGAERWRDTLVAGLVKLTGAVCIYERSDVDVRELEGLPQRTGLLYGAECPDCVQIQENGIKFRST